jgi:UPF0755 protein
MKKVITLVIFAVISLFGFIWWTNGVKPVNKKDTSQKIFVIERGEAIREVGNSLKEEGLIRDPVVFFLLIKKAGSEKAIQAGDYKLSPSMDLYTIVDTLKHGTLDLWVTIPEGFRAEEIASSLSENLPVDAVFRQKLAQEEGYLFPDTYLIPKDASAETVISIMKGNFSKKIQESGISQDKAALSRIVTIASLVEREAKFAEDAYLVASVISNRLEIGMGLQIDATVQYILGYIPAEKVWWKRHLTISDLKTASPYNTYIHAGLPPTPISNPGLNAIKAAANPAKTDYLYYVSDSAGHLHFAKTLDGHNQNVQKYIK